MLAHPSQPLAKHVQHKRDRYKRDRQECQSRARPRDTEILVHGSCEQGEASTEARSHEVVPGEDGSGILGVGISQVVQDRVEEQKRADGEECRSDDRL